jgi:hypothetical protein
MAYVIKFLDSMTKRGGMGNVLIKNHLYFHLSDYMKMWGPLSQMNSGPSESHHKTEVKAPSKNTQRRPATFIQQTSQRYTEIRVVRRACQKMGLSDQQILGNKPSILPASYVVSGARYSLLLQDRVPTMRWDSKSHLHRETIHPTVIALVCAEILPLLSFDDNREVCVPCFTEHKRWDGTQLHIFRAHPCYRSKENHPKDVWYDWADFSFEDDDPLPCQILCFLDLSNLPARHEVFSYRGYDIDAPGQYAVVRKFKSAPEHIMQNRLRPDGSAANETRSELVSYGDLEEGFFIFTCDAIHSPVCVVPNTPMISWEESRGNHKKRTRKEMELEARVVPVGGYMVLSPRSSWGEWFSESVVMNTSNEE